MSNALLSVPAVVGEDFRSLDATPFLPILPDPVAALPSVAKMARLVKRFVKLQSLHILTLGCTLTRENPLANFEMTVKRAAAEFRVVQT